MFLLFGVGLLLWLSLVFGLRFVNILTHYLFLDFLILDCHVLSPGECIYFAYGFDFHKAYFLAISIALVMRI